MYREDTRPKVYIVYRDTSDRYHYGEPDCLLAFFDWRTADEYAKSLEGHHDVYEVLIAPQVGEKKDEL